MTVANPNATIGGHAVVGCTWFDGKTPHADSIGRPQLKLTHYPPLTLERKENYVLLLF